MKIIQKGFTLIELMIVVAIIGILAAVAIPAYQDYVTKAKLSKAQATLAPLKTALGVYAQENGKYPVSVATSATPANASTNAPAGSVWTSIGLTKYPTVPVELASITYTADDADPQVVTLALTFAANGVGTGIDGLVLTQAAAIGGTGVTWACRTTGTTLTSTIAKKYFGCP